LFADVEHPAGELVQAFHEPAWIERVRVVEDPAIADRDGQIVVIAGTVTAQPLRVGLYARLSVKDEPVGQWGVEQVSDRKGRFARARDAAHDGNAPLDHSRSGQCQVWILMAFGSG